jgi:hypothetical protein
MNRLEISLRSRSKRSSRFPSFMVPRSKETVSQIAKVRWCHAERQRSISDFQCLSS